MKLFDHKIITTVNAITLANRLDPLDYGLPSRYRTKGYLEHPLSFILPRFRLDVDGCLDVGDFKIMYVPLLASSAKTTPPNGKLMPIHLSSPHDLYQNAQVKPNERALASLTSQHLEKQKEVIPIYSIRRSAST
ncbi:hypothetical protein CSKR_201322 [Clonorchis sinensis]|uniref:Uncharacterized protein n=1 Tax=Clonorchis sinensis TaxID=79923 RepID=A0A8T1MPP2_CLOSI|nr:hypothetical protein CSKR_201322 [Clonorchis sinensis]